MNHLLRLLLVGLICIGAAPVFAAETGTNPDVPKAKIAIIGGTYLNDILLDSGLLKKKFTIETKVGTSPTIHYGESDGVPFYYVHGHGEGKWLPTWVALHDLGVKEAVGGATAGGINTLMTTYDFVVPDDLIDFNTDRPKMIPPGTLSETGIILARLTPPMDPLIRDILIEETRKIIRADRAFDDINIHEKGVIIQAAGGRFETAAEIHYFRQIGGDLVTMSVGSEISYARQAGVNYACLVIISNPAEGIAPWSFDSLPKVYERLNPVSLAVLRAALPRLAELPAEGRVGDGLRIHPEMTSKPKK
ncbi:MAG TPA: hypothetical protein VIT21_03180 [Chthoniobacterales bacterium]